MQSFLNVNIQSGSKLLRSYTPILNISFTWVEYKKNNGHYYFYGQKYIKKDTPGIKAAT